MKGADETFEFVLLKPTGLELDARRKNGVSVRELSRREVLSIMVSLRRDGPFWSRHM